MAAMNIGGLPSYTPRIFSPLIGNPHPAHPQDDHHGPHGARKTFEAFSSTLRDETDLDALSNDLVGMVKETLRPAHSILKSRYSSTHLILAAIPRTSESADTVPGQDVHDLNSRIFGYFTGCLRTIFSKVAIVFQKDHWDEMVDARAGSRSKTRDDNPL